MTFEFPMKVIGEANRRGHWMKHWHRKKAQQYEVMVEWKRAFKSRRVELPCLIILTRIAPKLLDYDNLVSGFKAVRDQIASLIGVDDGSPLIRFEYRQEAVSKRQYAVRIEVQEI